MKVTQDQQIQDFSKIEKLTNQTTDAHNQNYDLEMQVLMEQKRLTLWIASLATALEVFLINQYEWAGMSSFSSVLFVAACVLFLINAISALTFYQMVVSMYAYVARKQNKLNLQRMLILNSLVKPNELTNELLHDLESDQFTLKIMNQGYMEKKVEDKNGAYKTGKLLGFYSDRNVTFLLILQLVVTITVVVLN